MRTLRLLVLLLPLLLPGPIIRAQDQPATPSMAAAGEDATAQTLGDTAPLKPYTLLFDSTRNGKMLGETEVTLKPLGDGLWEFAFDARATRGMASLIGFKFRESSVFRWHDGRPETIDYGYAKKSGFKGKRRFLHIDAGRERISGEDEDGEFTLAFQPQLIDRNLTLVAISADLLTGRRPLDYALVHKREITRRKFVVEGNETLATARGPLATVRVVRVLHTPGRITTLWLAPSLDYQPVQVRQVEVDSDGDGEVIELKLR